MILKNGMKFYSIFTPSIYMYDKNEYTVLDTLTDYCNSFIFSSFLLSEKIFNWDVVLSEESIKNYENFLWKTHITIFSQLQKENMDDINNMKYINNRIIKNMKIIFMLEEQKYKDKLEQLKSDILKKKKRQYYSYKEFQTPVISLFFILIDYISRKNTDMVSLFWDDLQKYFMSIIFTSILSCLENETNIIAINNLLLKYNLNRSDFYEEIENLGDDNCGYQKISTLAISRIYFGIMLLKDSEYVLNFQENLKISERRYFTIPFEKYVADIDYYIKTYLQGKHEYPLV